ncbi:pentapeptide repeat-containing protein [Halalkalicoccus salilacus]
MEISNADFSEATMSRTNMSGIKIESSNFNSTDLFKSDLSNALISSTNMYNTHLSDVHGFDSATVTLSTVAHTITTQDTFFINFASSEDISIKDFELFLHELRSIYWNSLNSISQLSFMDSADFRDSDWLIEAKDEILSDMILRQDEVDDEIPESTNWN